MIHMTKHYIKSDVCVADKYKDASGCAEYLAYTGMCTQVYVHRFVYIHTNTQKYKEGPGWAECILCRVHPVSASIKGKYSFVCVCVGVRIHIPVKPGSCILCQQL